MVAYYVFLKYRRSLLEMVVFLSVSQMSLLCLSLLHLSDIQQNYPILLKRMMIMKEDISYKISLFSK